MVVGVADPGNRVRLPMSDVREPGPHRQGALLRCRLRDRRHGAILKFWVSPRATAPVHPVGIDVEGQWDRPVGGQLTAVLVASASR